MSEPFWEGSSSQLAIGAAQLVALEHMCASKNKSAVNTLGAAATIHLRKCFVCLSEGIHDKPSDTPL